MSNYIGRDIAMVFDVVGRGVNAITSLISSTPELDSLRRELMAAARDKNLKGFEERLKRAESEGMFDGSGRGVKQLFMKPVEENGRHILLDELEKLEDPRFFKSVITSFPVFDPSLKNIMKTSAILEGTNHE